MSYLNATKRIVVPIKDARCIERLVTWLVTNPQPRYTNFAFVHALRPNWFDDIPYSSVQALKLIEDQKEITAKAQCDFNAMKQPIQQQFPQYIFSVRVSAERDDADAIVDFAESWQADRILILRRYKGFLRELLQGQLTARIMRMAKCVVEVIQYPQESKTPIATDKQKHGITLYQFTDSRSVPLMDEEEHWLSVN